MGLAFLGVALEISKGTPRSGYQFFLRLVTYHGGNRCCNSISLTSYRWGLTHKDDITINFTLFTKLLVVKGCLADLI